MRPWRLSSWTRFALHTCAKCGLCATACQPYLITRVGVAIPSGKTKLVLAAARGKFSDELKAIYEYCTLCGACEFRCPFGIQMPRAWLEARSQALSADVAPLGVKAVAKRLSETGNPYGAANEMRLEWAEFYGVDAAPNAKADVVYFVGCTASFRSECQTIAASFANVLSAAGVKWTFLGEKETCCGAPALMAGDVALAEDSAKRNVEAIRALGARIVVATCPACYRMLKWAYPKIVGPLDFEVVHAVEFAARAIAKGALRPSRLDAPATYHDPCELTRLAGLGAAARRAIGPIVELREMPKCGVNATCCGGGGLLAASNPDLRLEMAKRRVAEARDTGAELLVSACPSCKLTLSDGVKALETKLKVLDVTELLAEALGVAP